MKKIQIANTDMTASQIILGCMRINEAGNNPVETIQTAYDHGINFFDHADIYGAGECETIFAQALKETSISRSDIYLQSKVGIKPGIAFDFSKQHIIEAVEGSLKRLGTDYIDLYYIHRVDPNIPIEEVAQTMQEFKKEGKILQWGLSEASAETIRRAHHVEPLAAVQSEYSIWWRELEKEVIPTLEELKIGLVAYSPLGRGFLTGKLTRDAIASENDNRAELPRFTEEAFKANQVVLDLLQKIANEKEATIAQVSLAWLLAHKDWIVPIPGTTKLSRIDENTGATAIHFSKQELNDINHAVDQLEIVGDRYNQEQNSRTGK